MKRFTKGLKERWAPEHETDLMTSWGWTPAEQTPAVAKGRKETVSADPTVVPPKEDGSQLNQGEDDDSNSW